MVHIANEENGFNRHDLLFLGHGSNYVSLLFLFQPHVFAVCGRHTVINLPKFDSLNKLAEAEIIIQRTTAAREKGGGGGINATTHK